MTRDYLGLTIYREEFMLHINTTEVHAAIDRAAANIKKAGGDDGVVSRKDIKEKLKDLSGTERALTDVFYRFMDRRDAAPGARITATDIEKAVSYAKEKLVDRYDINNDGLSRSEIARMSKTGKLAVALAKELKTTSFTEIESKIRDAANHLYGGGEGGDVLPCIVEGTYDIGALSHPEVRELVITDWDRATRDEWNVDEMLTGAEAIANFRNRIGEYDSEEEISPAMRAFDEIFASLDNVRLITVGQEEDDYDFKSLVFHLVGNTPDNRVVGMSTDLVWT